MKKILILASVCLIAVSLTFAQAPVEKKGKIVEPKKTETVVKSTPKEKPAKLPKGIKSVSGTVVNLMAAVQGSKNLDLKKDAAVGMANRGEILGLKSGGKLYVVVFADGVNASKKLADKAGTTLNLKGKVLSKGGLTFLVVDSL